ncbi:MAG: xanthine dehydrogenase family protein molybdopterin-binding subunit, partial [Gammaproteobacteria bacterium]
MKKFGIGQPLRRREDRRFLTGRGCYTDDIHLDGELVGLVLRAPFAHGRITELDVSEAAAAPGVKAVLTAATLKEMGVGNEIPCLAP